jgi:hypothetical protein
MYSLAKLAGFLLNPKLANKVANNVTNSYINISSIFIKCLIYSNSSVDNNISDIDKQDKTV